jgi:sigma-E factor negative regulatory protein RseC
VTGRILSVSGSTVTVMPDLGDACFGCLNKDCKKRPPLITAENPGGLNLSPGQFVETSVSPPAAAGEAAFVLLPPAAAFAVGFWGIGHFLPGLGEGACILGAFVLAAFTVLARVLMRRPGSARSRIVRITNSF